MQTLKVRYVVDGMVPMELNDKGDWIDLRAAEDVKLKKGDHMYISLGFAMQLPDGYEAHVAPRSSTYKNFGIIQTNSVAVIDNSYRGNNDIWKYPILAMRDTEIHKNDRICQFRIVKKMEPVVFQFVDEFENSEDRGGFGSTGIQ